MKNLLLAVTASKAFPLTNVAIFITFVLTFCLLNEGDRRERRHASREDDAQHMRKSHFEVPSACHSKVENAKNTVVATHLVAPWPDGARGRRRGEGRLAGSPHLRSSSNFRFLNRFTSKRQILVVVSHHRRSQDPQKCFPFLRVDDKRRSHTS